jgi:hypothetical protein
MTLAAEAVTGCNDLQAQFRQLVGCKLSCSLGGVEIIG